MRGYHVGVPHQPFGGKTWQYLFLLALLAIPYSGLAITICDEPDTDLSTFFRQAKAKYILRYAHRTDTEILLPPNVTLEFEGGAIHAPLTFDNTLLRGEVKLQGSSIKGSLKNKTFNASWLCYADGKRDDATNINSILSLCNHIFFPKGLYKLESTHSPLYPINKPYHIGINRGNTTLKGEEGATLVTDRMAGTLCIYSKPYDIPGSIRNIRIEGITFKVENEATTFDKSQEHCHTISLMGVNGCSITRCTFQNFWGDAICLNHYNDNEKTGERTRNIQVTVKDNRIDGYRHSNRNGISIISGEHVKVQHNTLINCSHASMPGAIDIEPNCHVYTIRNIRIEHNHIDRCQGANAAISVVSNLRRGPAHDIRIQGNIVTRSSRGLEFAVECDNAVQDIRIENNLVDEYTDPYIFYGHGQTRNWVFRNNTFKCVPKAKFGGSIQFIQLKKSGNEIKETAWLLQRARPYTYLACLIGIALPLTIFVRKRNHRT